MATNNIVLITQYAFVMARSEKLSLIFWHQNSKNISSKIFIAFLEAARKLDKNPLRTIVQHYFQHSLCVVIYAGMEEPLCGGHHNASVEQSNGMKLIGSFVLEFYLNVMR